FFRRSRVEKSRKESFTGFLILNTYFSPKAIQEICVSSVWSSNGSPWKLAFSTKDLNSDAFIKAAVNNFPLSLPFAECYPALKPTLGKEAQAFQIPWPVSGKLQNLPHCPLS